MEQAPFLFLIVGILLFFALRELFCWYWKLNAIVERLDTLIEQTSSDDSPPE